MATEGQVRQVLERRAAGESVRAIADALGLPYSTAIGIANGTHNRDLLPELPRYVNGKAFHVNSAVDLEDIAQRREVIVTHVLSSVGMPWRQISATCPIKISTEYARKIAYGVLHVKIAPHMERLTKERRHSIPSSCSECRFYEGKKSEKPCNLEIPELNPKRCGSFFPNT
jgi:hypothetical protein